MLITVESTLSEPAAGACPLVFPAGAVPGGADAAPDLRGTPHLSTSEGSSTKSEVLSRPFAIPNIFRGTLSFAPIAAGADDLGAKRVDESRCRFWAWRDEDESASAQVSTRTPCDDAKMEESECFDEFNGACLSESRG